MKMRAEYRFPWSLVDRFVCLYCWSAGRYLTDAVTGKHESLSESWHCARECKRLTLKRKKARK